jgi:hypothetical protein
VFRSGWHFLLPIAFLVFSRLYPEYTRLTPEKTAIVCTLMIVVLTYIFGYRRKKPTMRETVQAVIDSTGVGEFDVCRVLYDLLNRNLVAPAGKGAAKVVQEEEPTGGIVSATPGYAVSALVVLLAAGGVFAQRSTPFAVTGLDPVLLETTQKVRESLSFSRLQRIERGVAAYALRRGGPPKRLEDLVDEGLLDASYLHDPWQRPYHYEPGANGFSLSAVDDHGKELPETVIRRSLASSKP